MYDLSLSIETVMDRTFTDTLVSLEILVDKGYSYDIQTLLDPFVDQTTQVLP